MNSRGPHMLGKAGLIERNDHLGQGKTERLERPLPSALLAQRVGESEALLAGGAIHAVARFIASETKFTVHTPKMRIVGFDAEHLLTEKPALLREDVGHLLGTKEIFGDRLGIDQHGCWLP